MRPYRLARDLPRLTAAQSALAGEFFGAVLRLARPHQKRAPSLADEIESAAVFALIRAVIGYQGGPFASYLHRYVNGSIADVFRKRTHQSCQSLDGCEPIDPHDDIADLIGQDSVEAIRRTLRPLDQQIFDLIGVKGFTQAETAQRLGYSQPEILRRRNLIRKQIESWHSASGFNTRPTLRSATRSSA